MKHFNIFGLRRTGNHTIIEWVAKHFNHTIHHNDCWDWPVPNNYWSRKEYGNIFTPVDLTIFSYEDFEPSEEEVVHSDSIILFRDWYNIAASRHVSGRGYKQTARYRHKSGYNRDVLEVWLKYAYLYKKYPEKFILFNQWVTQEDYRVATASKLGLEGYVLYTEELPESKIGNGSSFGEKRINPLDVNSRYTKLAKEHPQAYADITGNAEVNGLCEEIFNIKLK
jgi:hypothetical protein